MRLQHLDALRHDRALFRREISIQHRSVKLSTIKALATGCPLLDLDQAHPRQVIDDLEQIRIV